jgi:hypothetical protein
LRDVVEEGGINWKGLGKGRQWGFAGPAAAGIGEVLGWDAVLLLTMGASAYDGHAGLLEMSLDSMLQEQERRGW